MTNNNPQVKKMRHSLTQTKQISSLATPNMRQHALVALIIAAIGLAACGKSERQMTTEERLKAVQTKQETQPDFFVQRKTVDYMGDLKAIRDNAPKAEPVKPEIVARAEPRPVTQAETRAAVAPITQAPAPVVAQPAPQVIAPVVPTPAPVAVAPAPRPSADTTTTAINREQPSFPREAVRQGVESGTVRARMTINAAGDVTAVTIVSARPARVFDREVQSALQRWKFNPGADGRSFETEVNFQR
jgi:TonB family protein